MSFIYFLQADQTGKETENAEDTLPDIKV